MLAFMFSSSLLVPALLVILSPSHGAAVAITTVAKYTTSCQPLDGFFSVILTICTSRRRGKSVGLAPPAGLKARANPLTFCYDPDASHGGVVLTQAQYLSEWIANQTLGAEIQSRCPKSYLTSIKCDPLLPNE